MRLTRIATAVALAAGSVFPGLVQAQRVLGIDVSIFQGNIGQSTWDDIYNVDNRKFTFIRSSRGGTTGEDHRQGGYSAGNNTFFNLSERYDDPNFVQNITRATASGLMAGPYHFAKVDVVAGTTNSGGIPNNGTDEANHFIEMAGAWMRPGYLQPVFDLEAGETQRTSSDIAQFAIDFSNRIYAVTSIRPGIYLNGNYSNILQNASLPLRDQLAKPPVNPANRPSLASPAYSMIWNARIPAGPNPQTQNPKDTASTFYGPWDDYGNTNPWNFWQYSNTTGVTGIPTVDMNVSHGDMEYLKDFLVPAVWMNDTSGNWSTLANWNSGQTPVAPISAPGQLAPLATGPLPTPRAAGVAGPSITDGQNDTVILDRPSANITVTLSSGDYSVRKFYMREALNITGGSLTVNYDRQYTTSTFTGLRSGNISAQFSGPVTLSGGALNVTDLQVDAGQTFTVAGGTLTFRTITLMSGSPSARMVLSSNLDVNPSAGQSVSINGDFSTPSIDLAGGNRAMSVAAGGELFLGAGLTNGALTKTGPGTLRLTALSNYAGGTNVTAGTLIVEGSTGSGDVTVGGAGAVLTGYGSVDGSVTVNSGGTLAPGEGADSINVNTNVTFNAGSTLEYEFYASNYSVDLLNVGGNLNLVSNPTLNLLASADTLLPRRTKFAVASYGGAWNGGTFAGYANGSLLQLGPNTFRLKYDDDNSNTQNFAPNIHAVTLETLTGPVRNFVDEYDIANLTINSANAHSGYVDTGSTPYSLSLLGPEDGSGLAGEIGTSIPIAGDGTLSFDWYFFNNDPSLSDVAYYSLNGNETLLSSSQFESGHVEIAVAAGDVFGWRVVSPDSSNGQGYLYLYDFLAPAPPFVVPEPASVAGVILLAGLQLTRRRR